MSLSFGDDLDVDDLAELDEEQAFVDLSGTHVLAVLVSHDGARWLTDTLAGLAEQTHQPEQVVAVDVTSGDNGPKMLRKALGQKAMTTVPRSTGFGAAVAAGVLAAGAPAEADSSWIWLLHDDSAPDPTTLEQLLRYAVSSPSAGIVGSKAVDWDDPRLLIDIGSTSDTTGRRESGLEPREFDQGQHDSPRDVLSVGSAGMLVRRDVWEALDGFDPALGLFRDDLDLCWRAALAGHRVVIVPAAKVRHARAATTGRRVLAAIEGPPHRADRRHGLHVVLANARPLAAFLGVPRLAIGVLLRALIFLLTRRPHLARDELSGLGIILGLPRLVRARRWRSGQRTEPYSVVKPLLAGRSARLRGYADAIVDWASGGAAQEQTATGGRRSAETGPGSEDEEIPTDDSALLRRVLTHPSLILVVGLSLLSLVAVRHLLGSGALVGGRLLSPAGGAIDLWRAHADSWHEVGAGAATPTAPWVPGLAALSTVLLGKPWLAIDVLVLGAVPLAGLVFYRALRDVTSSPLVRTWAAVAYALSPPLLAIVAGGRFDAAVVGITAPLLVRSLVRAVTVDPQGGGWPRAWARGLGLAFVASFWPPVLLIVAVVLLGGLAATVRLRAGGAGSLRRRSFSCLATLAVPVALGAPWWPALVDDWQALLVGLGSPGGLAGIIPDRAARGTDLLLLRPQHGIPGWTWLVVPLIVAALAALLRRSSGFARSTWAVALIAWAAALVISRAPAGVGGDPSLGWPGAALAITTCALLFAGARGATGARARLAEIHFGWRQPLAAVVALAAGLAPLFLAAQWADHGASGELQRRSVGLLPPFTSVDQFTTPGQRVLVLREDATGTAVRYELSKFSGPHLGDEEVRERSAATRVLTTAVSDLTTQRGTDAAELLSTFAVEYVAVPHPPLPSLLEALDSQSALSRVAFDGPVTLWRLTMPVNRLAVLSPPLAAAAVKSPDLQAGQGRGPDRGVERSSRPLPIRTPGEGARTAVPPGPEGRLLVLAEPAGAGWVATINGQRLHPRTAWGWAQAFDVPSAGGALRVRHATNQRHTLLAVQIAVLIVVLVLSAPELGRSDEFSPPLPEGAP